MGHGGDGESSVPQGSCSTGLQKLTLQPAPLGRDFNSVCNSYQKQWAEDLLIFGFSLLYGGAWDHRNQKQSSLQRWSLPENWHDASLG